MEGSHSTKSVWLLMGAAGGGGGAGCGWGHTELCLCGGPEAVTQGKPVFTTGNIGRGLNTALGGRVLGGGG